MKSLYVVHFYGKVGGSGLGRQGLLLGFQENDLYYDDMSLMLFFTGWECCIQAVWYCKELDLSLLMICIFLLIFFYLLGVCSLNITPMPSFFAAYSGLLDTWLLLYRKLSSMYWIIGGRFTVSEIHVSISIDRLPLALAAIILPFFPSKFFMSM